MKKFEDLSTGAVFSIRGCVWKKVHPTKLWGAVEKDYNAILHTANPERLTWSDVALFDSVTLVNPH